MPAIERGPGCRQWLVYGVAVRSRWADIPFERVSKATLSHCVFHSNNSDNSRALVDVLTITYVPRPLLKSISTRQNYTKFSKTIPILSFSSEKSAWLNL